MRVARRNAPSSDPALARSMASSDRPFLPGTVGTLIRATSLIDRGRREVRPLAHTQNDIRTREFPLLPRLNSIQFADTTDMWLRGCLPVAAAATSSCAATVAARPARRRTHISDSVCRH